MVDPERAPLAARHAGAADMSTRSKADLAPDDPPGAATPHTPYRRIVGRSAPDLRRVEA